MGRLLTLMLSLVSISILAQSPPVVQAFRADGEIRIDGIADEADWQKALPICDFHQQFPSDTMLAVCQTVVRVLYDEEYLYVQAEMAVKNEGDYVISSLRRDFDGDQSDAFFVYIDPFNDQLNGYSFGTNPEGVQVEGLIVNGGVFGTSNDWDCKWFVETSRSSNSWVVEIAIPFSSIKYRSSEDSWKINFSRNDLRTNETSVWSPVPLAFNPETLSNTGILEWADGPPDQQPNIALIPYGIGRLTDDYTDNESAQIAPNAGLDARMTVLRSLTLDLTFNPDFSQVEVDQQVTNLSRFSLFFPERRNFFLENNDLFGLFGFSQIRPFFSRQIGLFQGQTVPILGGARLSGKINRNWRIGFMNMQTEGNGELGLRPQNYTVGAFQRRVGTRSNIAGIVVNRQGFEGTRPDGSDYNRLVGLDYNIFSKDNRFRGKLFYHHTFTPNVKNLNFAHASWLMYSDNNWQVMWNHEYVGENYRADVGFVPRIENFDPESETIDYRTYWRLEPELTYTWYPKKWIIQAVSHSAYLSQYMSDAFNTTESRFNLRSEFVFRNQAYLGFGWVRQFTELFYPFDVTGQQLTPHPAGDYLYDLAGIWFESAPAKRFTWSGSIEIGEYFTGTNNQVQADVGYRIQPFGSVRISAQYNQIRLPDPYPDADLWLIGPRIDLSFTRSLFFTTFIQYNTQVENVNINARLQWRFKPMSDLFIVYTDNYRSDILGIQNRALVVKLSYWFNL